MHTPAVHQVNCGNLRDLTASNLIIELPELLSIRDHEKDLLLKTLEGLSLWRIAAV